MKKNRIITSILTIVLCVSLVIGSTYALFTSEDKINISVTAGKLEVYASLSDITTISMSEETNPQGTFNNGGTAVYENGVLTINDITPGDKVTFNVNIDNYSNIFVKYRLVLVITDTDDVADAETPLSQKLVAIAELPNEGTTQLSATENITAWADLSGEALGTSKRTTFPMSVELPALTGNDYQGNSATVKIFVEAVQANQVG